MSLVELPNELLLHIMQFFDFGDHGRFRLICRNCNIINYKQLEDMYRKYCKNKYVTKTYGTHSYYTFTKVNTSNNNNEIFNFCEKCSKNFRVNKFGDPFKFQLGFGYFPCTNDKQMNVCSYGKPHMVDCDCPLANIKCTNCHNVFYKFQYDLHLNKCGSEAQPLRILYEAI